MEENKYYIPDMEDVYIGYEFELQTINGWKKGKFPELLKCNSELYEFGNDDFMKLAHAICRTPFLTKEQIEVEKEWEWSERNGWFAHGENDEWLLNVGSSDKIPLWINMWNDDTGETYFGYCKSINEFRKICKWLNIK